MNSTTHTSTITPPRLIASLVSGFNLVTGKIYLILLPVALDLLLWFGPHFRVRTLVQPFIKDWLDGVNAMGGADYVNMVATVRNLWNILLDRFNLVSLLSTLPIGVPSLLTGSAPIKTPLGDPTFYEISSWGQVISGWLLFTLLGLAFGSLYFNGIARSSATPAEPFSMQRAVWEIGQTILMALIILLILVILSIPVTFITAILAMINPAIAQISLLLTSFVLLWILIPLIFSPHGIYAVHQNVVRSMLISVRMVRLLFPGVSLFLISLLILAQGMSYLWRIPPENSWLTLASILGNAFISTSLLTASFVYYRGAIGWVEQLKRSATNYGTRI
jgi:hypothetical protein